jgi:hypothetical protein
MNPDFVIGTRNPGVIMERYLNDVRDNDRIAYPRAEEEETQVAATAETPEQVNMAAIEVRPDDADGVERTEAPSTGRRERGRGPEAMEGDLTFEDVLDILNPLQHLPVISHIYRAVSGDEIKGFAEVAGSAIFGGPIGIITGAFNAMFEDETGESPVTMVANLLGFGDDKPKLEAATLETQLAEAEHNIVTDEETPAQVQVASSTKIPKTLDAQVASAMLPPIPPSPTQTANAKAPFGGIMDMSTIKAANQQQAAAVANNETPRASPLPGASIPNLATTPHPPVEINGQKFYSLAGVRRTGDNAPSMPIHSGPDVRLKPLSRQSASGVITPTQTIAASPKTVDPEAAKALGLSVDGSDMAELGLKDTPPLLTPEDADLLPAYSGGGSQPVPNALVEDMMRMGLEKYRQGIDSGALSPRPSVDIRG